MVSLVISAQISSGVTETAQDRHHSRGTFEAGSSAVVRFLYLCANLFQQFGRDPTSRRLPLRHLLRCFPAQHINVPQDWAVDGLFVHVSLEFAEFSHVVAELRDDAIGTRRDFLLHLQILVGAIRFRVLEGRNRNRNPERHPALACFINEAHELDGVQIEQRFRGLQPRRLGVITCQRENIFDSQGMQVFEGPPSGSAVAADAGQMNVGCEPTGACGGAHADGIMADGPARITGDTSGDNTRHLRQLRSDFQEARFARQAAGDQFHDVAESPGAQGFAEWVYHIHFSASIPCVPHAFLPPSR